MQFNEENLNDSLYSGLLNPLYTNFVKKSMTLALIPVIMTSSGSTALKLPLKAAKQFTLQPLVVMQITGTNHCLCWKLTYSTSSAPWKEQQHTTICVREWFFCPFCLWWWIMKNFMVLVTANLVWNARSHINVEFKGTHNPWQCKTCKLAMENWK